MKGTELIKQLSEWQQIEWKCEVMEALLKYNETVRNGNYKTFEYYQEYMEREHESLFRMLPFWYFTSEQADKWAMIALDQQSNKQTALNELKQYLK